jgi:uncharacterized protein (TIGR04141 family)
MKADDGKRTMSLSLRLLRNGRSVEDALREDHSLDEVDAKDGRLFVGQADDTPPTWLGFVGDFANAPIGRLSNKSCGSVLFLKVPDPAKPKTFRTIAITFGTAHHALNGNAFERNFGLRVVLNCVSRASLRSLDVATLDATTFQKRIQSSRNADLQGFGIDVERDLLRLAAGVPKDASFAKSVAGRDALTLHTTTSSSDIISKCEAALKFYQSADYKVDFEWIDFVTPVRDDDIIKKLDDLAFAELANLVNGGTSDLHLALPDILSPEDGYEIGYFGVGLRPGAKETFTELAIEDYVAQLQAGKISDIPDMAALRSSHEVRVVKDGEGDKNQKRKLYECFVFELDKAGSAFVLFGGDWFQIDKTFRTAVENDFARFVSAAPFCASTFAKNERDFITELDRRADLLNLDQVKLDPLGARGAMLEPCDFFSRKKQFIHLKDGHSSAPISHLWNQAIVSAESFVRDEKFRVDLRKAAIKRQKRKPKKNGFEKLLPDGRAKPVPSDYAVVFGIMRNRYKKSGSLGIPFFSKVSLRAIADRISLMGFPLEVHLVERKSLP